MIKSNLDNIKFTGTTIGFEHYYGEILHNGKVVTEYYYKPTPHSRFGRGYFRTRQKFGGQQIVAKSLEKLRDRVLVYPRHI